jgi:hypothetical protein
MVNSSEGGVKQKEVIWSDYEEEVNGKVDPSVDGMHLSLFISLSLLLLLLSFSFFLFISLSFSLSLFVSLSLSLSLSFYCYTTHGFIIQE